MTESKGIIAPGDTQALKDLLSISPFHRWLGLEIVEQSSEQLVIAMPWRDEIVSNPMIGAAHGGILSALIDLTGLYTVIAAGGIAKATADLRVDFHKAATRGRLTAIGRPVKIGRLISIADTRVTSADETLLASGRGAYVNG